MEKYQKNFAACLLMVLAACVVYAKAFTFQLVYLDDNVWIQDYGWLFQDFKNANRLFTQPDFISNVFWRPLLNLSFFIDAQWAGDSLISYRVTNLLIHLANGCLVFYLFNLLGFKWRMAFSLALIFSVHPVLTAAVVWIPGRTDSLFAFMSLLSFIFYIRTIGKNNWIEKAAHYLFFVFALLSKETAVAIPMVCFLYSSLIIKGRFSRRLPDILWWSLLIAIFMMARGHIIADSNHVVLSAAAQSFFANSSSFISYLGKIFLPVNLSVLPNLQDITLLWGLISLAGLIIAIFLSTKKAWPMIIFGLAWFLLFLSPSLIISFLTHEYRLYLPMLGVLMMVGSLDLVNRLSENKMLWWVLTGAIVIVFGTTTFLFSENFRGRIVFWDNAINNSPHLALAHRNRGAMYHLDGKMDEAEVSYKRAAELNSDEFMVNNNLGLIYMSRGDYKTAEQYYLREIQINPTYDNVYLNLGLLYYQTKNDEAAVQMWKKAIELNPNFMDVYKNLMVYYYQKKDYQNMSLYANWLKAHGAQLPPQVLNVLP